MSSFLIPTPFSNLRVITENDALLFVIFDKHSQSSKPPKTPFEKQIADQILQYLDDPNFQFSIPYRLNGTSFQCKVWETLRTIPAGKTLTYGELALQLKTHSRAVGQACRRNPIPIIIPCHRIIGQRHVGGFSGEEEGEFIEIKKWLIKHEQA